MTAPTTPQEAVDQAILQPASVTDNGRTIVNRPISEIQDARDREAAATAGRKNLFGLRFTKLVPPRGG